MFGQSINQLNVNLRRGFGRWNTEICLWNWKWTTTRRVLSEPIYKLQKMFVLANKRTSFSGEGHLQMTACKVLRKMCLCKTKELISKSEGINVASRITLILTNHRSVDEHVAKIGISYKQIDYNKNKWSFASYVNAMSCLRGDNTSAVHILYQRSQLKNPKNSENF